MQFTKCHKLSVIKLPFAMFLLLQLTWSHGAYINFVALANVAKLLDDTKNIDESNIIRRPAFKYGFSTRILK